MPPVNDDLSALQLVLSADPALVAIVRLAMVVSLSAVLFAALIGIPLGASIAVVIMVLTLGVTLLGETPSPASLPRSDQRVSRPVNKPDKAGAALLGSVELSEPPAYEQVALANVALAWELAGLLAVLVGAVATAVLRALL